MIKISVQAEDFDLAQELASIRHERNDIGAVASFVGLVRDHNLDDDVAGLSLSHYPGMTEKSLATILETAQQRWDIRGASVIHRVGNLTISEQIVMVAIASAHRGDAFATCEFIMDYLKTQAPFWKKELLRDGSSRWLDARKTDIEAATRWQED